MRQLQINLDEFAFLLHRGKTLDLYCFLNTTTGDIVSIPSDREMLIALLKLPEGSEMLTTHSLVARLIPDGQDFLTIPDNFRVHIFKLMSDFINSIRSSHPNLATKLDTSIHENNGYKSFMNTIRKDGSVFNRYLRYRDQFFEQSARAWLTENEIELV